MYNFYNPTIIVFFDSGNRPNAQLNVTSKAFFICSKTLLYIKTFDVELDLLYIKQWLLVVLFMVNSITWGLPGQPQFGSPSIVTESCASALKFDTSRETRGNLQYSIHEINCWWVEISENSLFQICMSCWVCCGPSNPIKQMEDWILRVHFTTQWTSIRTWVAVWVCLKDAYAK